MVSSFPTLFSRLIEPFFSTSNPINASPDSGIVSLKQVSKLPIVTLCSLSPFIYAAVIVYPALAVAYTYNVAPGFAEVISFAMYE